MKKTKWFIYSLIVGLIPFLSRLLIFLVINNKSANFLFNEVDFIILGLVLNITNINELESSKIDDERWKTQSIGISVIFIVFCAVFLAISAISEIQANLISFKSIIISSIILSIASAIFGYSVFNRISNLEGNI